MSQDQGMDVLWDEYTNGRVDRRELFRRAALAGASASAMATMFGMPELAGASVRAKGGTLRIGGVSDQGSMDPATNSVSLRGATLGGIYEGLIAYKLGTFETRNVLAEEFHVSSDGTKISFTLRKGVQFQAGYGEVTSEDVKFSFERTAGLRKLYPDARKSDVSFYTGDWGQLRRVRKTGKYSGVIELKKPFSPALTIALPFGTSGAVTSERAVNALKRAKFPTHPVGTGPYEVTSYTPNKQLILTRFADYSHSDPFNFEWDQIEYFYRAIGSSSSGAAYTIPLETGEVDAMPSISSRTDVQHLSGNSKFRTQTVPSLGWTWLSMNVLHPKLTDIRVRQAIRAALDVPAVLAVDNVPAEARAYAEISKAFKQGYWADAPRYNRDVNAAKALLQQAGVSSLELDLFSDEAGPAQVIQQNLGDVGITVNILTTTYQQYFTNKATAQLTFWSYSGAPDLYYQLEWWTKHYIDQWNLSFWDNPAYDALLDKLSRTQNPVARGRIAIEMQKLMDASASFVWYYYPPQYAASKANIKMAFDASGAFYPEYFTSS